MIHKKDEFKVIKTRFTELSDFIKDVRFMRNLKINNKGNADFDAISFMKKARKLSKKMNFDKPQEITKEEEDKYIINNNTNISYEGEKFTNNILKNIGKDKDEGMNEEYNNIKIDENKDINNEEKKVQKNKNDKKKFNIKLNIKDSNANSQKSTIKNTNKIDDNNNNTLLSAKSRNFKKSLNSEKKANDKRKFNF